MPTPLAELSQRRLTGIINNIRTGNSFVRKFLFANEHTNPGDRIAIETIVGGRKMAPFTRKGGPAKHVEGYTDSRKEFECSSIKIMRTFSADAMAFIAHIGGPRVFLSDGQEEGQRSAIEAKISREIAGGRDMIDETIEWMCCQVLNGSITYNIAGADDEKGEWWTIDYGRPGANTVTQAGATLWTHDDCDIGDQVEAVQELANSTHGMAVTDAIMGRSAATAFRKNKKFIASLDNRRLITSESLDLRKQFRDDGAKLVAEDAFGIRWWRYGRQTTGPDGSTIDLIAPTRVHYVCNTPAAKNVLEFGAIADFDAEERSGLFKGSYFSKSWKIKNPSSRVWQAQSRPLTVPYRPDTMYTHTVV